jgi:hypothetical protein
MLKVVTPCGASQPVFHTIFGSKLYNRPLRTRDRIMPTIQPYTRLAGSIPFGVKSYVPTPTITLNPYYTGRFAIQDQPKIERKPPWERIIR